MKQVHVECKPDEVLVKKLGFTRKQIRHHAGKSRIFSSLSKTQQQLALADEDPGSPQTSGEKLLKSKSNIYGVQLLFDQRGNTVCLLNVKLENWILSRCKESEINLGNYGLPNNADELHGVINSRLLVFEKVLDDLIAKNNPGILHLKSVLI